MLRVLFTFSFFIWMQFLSGQNVTIINSYDGVDAGVPLEQLVLRQVSEQTIILNVYEPANVGVRSQLEQMINYGLRSYIDSQYHLFDGRVECIAPQVEFSSATSAIVKNAIWIHEQDFIDEFSGFSKETTSIAAKLPPMDGLVFKTGNDEMSPPNRETVGLYYFQRVVLDLKLACESEIDRFLDEKMPYKSPTQGGDITGTPILKNTDFTLVNPNADQFQLLDVKIDESLLFEDSKPLNSKRRGKRGEQAEFNERVLTLLESNNRIMESYGTRFDLLQAQIDALRSGNRESSDPVLQEIAALRELIAAVSEGREIQESDGSRTRLVSEEGMTIRYEKNAHELTAAQKQRLTALKRLLEINPGYTALITGYADKSGNAELNEWISRKRAEAVKNYLTIVGIDQNRLIVNFLGDAKSTAVGPEDRKVEIKFLLNYTALR